MDHHGGFFAGGCELGEAELTIRDGSTIVQTIEVEVVPPSE